LKNVNARDFNFLSFAEIYVGLYNISNTKIQGSQIKAVILRDSPTKYIMPYCHFIGGNYWILKTTYQNRGIGIHVFKSISQLISIILSYTKNIKHDEPAADKGKEDEKDNKTQENKLKNNLQVFSSPIQITKSMSFIIQKYIERPFLIYNRKFDIRVWVLINQDMEVYFFKEGYLRTSAFGYKLDNC
tara:strand:+ start:2462 stop:3022 length:561 start_codon:yes stop_codon:yes gene_type:complete